jgi:multiple sugar transport system permease protein/N,N'-diacetylchitobiose transport system permease protein
LILPALIVVGWVVIYPILRTLWMSFFNIDSPQPGKYPFIGLGNYFQAFNSSDFRMVVGHSLYFTLVSTFLELSLGILIALLLNAPLKFLGVWRSLVVIPWALPTIVNGALWRWIYNDHYGVLNAILHTTHICKEPHFWLGSPFLALNMVIIADVWKNTSLVVFFILAGLQTIPKDLYESARVDGASPIKAFWNITVPLLLPSILVVLILRTIDAFKVFDIIYIMTKGGPASGTQTISFYTYQQTFSNEYFGYGSALAYLIVAVILVMAWFYIKALRQDELED